MLKQLDTLIGFAVVMSVVSLLITIITQIVSSLLGLRGKNLADALEAMAHKIDPKIDEQVKGLAMKLADRVLTHPVISDSSLSMARSWPTAWKRASAIRPNELLEILEHLAGQTVVPATGPKTVEEAAAKMLLVLRTPSSATSTTIAALTAQLPALAAQKGKDIINEFNVATNVALGNVEQWFDSTQDRAKQWFAMHARVVSVIAAVVVAFGLQLDSFTLLNRISSDPEFRARLVASAPALQKQAQEVFEAADPKSPALHTNIVAKLNAKYPGLEKVLKSETNFVSQADAMQWVSNRIASTTTYSNKVNEILAKYPEVSAEASKEELDKWVDRFGTINAAFSKTGIELIPDPYPSFPWGFFGPLSHFAGLLASAALLSLGAPFWFNILKTFTNLRPMLAQQVDKDKNASKPN